MKIRDPLNKGRKPLKELSRKADRYTKVPVPQTDSGGRDEYSQARERTTVKELGKIAP